MILLQNWKVLCPLHLKAWNDGARGHWHPMPDASDCRRSPVLMPMLRDRLRNTAWDKGWNKKDLNEWLKAERGGTFSALNTDAKIDAAVALETIDSVVQM